jgi:hypothetical protein
MVAWIRAAVPIAQQAVFAKGVVVWARLPIDHWNGRDAKRDRAEHARLEDTLRAEKRNPLTVAHEPPLEQPPGKRTILAGEPRLLLDESKRCHPNREISVVHRSVQLF